MRIYPHVSDVPDPYLYQGLAHCIVGRGHELPHLSFPLLPSLFEEGGRVWGKSKGEKFFSSLLVFPPPILCLAFLWLLLIFLHFVAQSPSPPVLIN